MPIGKKTNKIDADFHVYFLQFCDNMKTSKILFCLFFSAIFMSCSIFKMKKKNDVANFVMIGIYTDSKKTQVWYSDDAKTWEEGTLPENARYNKAIWIKDRYYAFDPYKSIIIYSSDGKVWKKCSTPGKSKPRGIVFDGKNYIAYTDNRNFSNTITNYPNPFLISKDGVNFEILDNKYTTNLHCDAACYGNDKAIFADWDSPILVTSNMQDFEQISVNQGGHFSAQFFNGKFIISCANGNCVLVSEDAKNWKRVKLPSSVNPLCVLVGENEVIITNQSGQTFAKSKDGYNWEAFTAPMISNGYDGIYANDRWYFRNNDNSGIVYESFDLNDFRQIGKVSNMQCENICAFASRLEKAQRY